MQFRANDTVTAPTAVRGWQPLAGLRVIEVSTYVAGPSGAMALAQLGAEVVRVDPIGGATDVGRLPLAPSGASIYWAGLNRAKCSIEVDLRSDAGQRLVVDLLQADAPSGGILLTNAVGQRWLGYEALRAERPDLIHVQIEGLSNGGPAVDYTVNSAVGLPLVTGPDMLNQPVNHVLPAWDLLTGAHAAMAVLAADRHRQATGEGRSITVSLADVAVATMAHLGFIGDVVVNGTSRLREGNYLYGSFGCDFATADGERVMVVALTPRQWKHLLEVTRLEEVVAALETSLGADLSREEERYHHREVLAALLRPWFVSRPYQVVAKELDESGVLWGSYRTVEQLVAEDDSLLAQSGIFAAVDQPGIGTYPAPGSVLRAAGSPAEVREAPQLGEHTDDVLADRLGLEPARLEQLRNAGVIGGTEQIRSGGDR